MYTYMDTYDMYYTIYFEISMTKYTLYTAILVNELDQKLHWPATPPLYGALQNADVKVHHFFTACFTNVTPSHYLVSLF